MEWRKPEPKIFSVLCLCVCPWRKSNLASIFFFVRTNFSSWSIFSFPNPIDGSVSPEQKSWHTFLERLPSHRKVRAHGSVPDLRLLKSRLAMQSSQRLAVRVHYADKLLESIEYERFQHFGKWVGWETIITQGCLSHFFTFVLDDGWIYSWERTSFFRLG